mgnify:CR=1 FL=1
MAYQINVLPSGRQFQAEDGETILAAALRQGIGLPYGCKNGACGSCKGHVREGSIVQGNHSPNALSAQEATEGRALFCCATPATDVTIEVREVQGAGDVPIKKIPCRVASLEILVPTPAIRNLIRDDKVHQIYGAMQSGQEKYGMQTANQSLASLCQRRLITLDAALAASSNKDELQDMINRGVGVVAGAGLGGRPGAPAARPPIPGRT